MSDASFEPVAMLADLETLNDDEIVQGYRDFRPGDPEPGPNRGRSYWHGWCNRARDAGLMPGTWQSGNLAREFLKAEREKRAAVTH